MDAAERAGDHLKEAGAQAGESLMNAAEERGLTGEGLKEVAREVGDAFSNALSGEQLPKQAYRAASSQKQASISRQNEHTPRPQGSQNASTHPAANPTLAEDEAPNERARKS